MKVKKYKYLGASRYKVFFNENEYTLYEDIIIKYNILLREDLTDKDFELFLLDNAYYEAYYKSIKYIGIKLRTKKELEKYLNKNNFDSKIIKEVIEKIEKDGYLDQTLYAKSYIYDQINLKMTGPEKIKKELLELGIEKHIIENEIEEFTQELINQKLNKLIDKTLKTNTKSAYYIKNKIIINLINQGYKKEDIITILNTKEIDDSNSYQKEYDKLYKKYSKKYTGKELEYFIKQKLYAKGFKQNNE